MDEEFQAVGVPRKERGARTDEALEVMRLLWRSTDPVSFDGRFSRFRDMVLCSHPVQTGSVVPVLIGGNSDGALRRAARLGDGWLGMEVFVDQVADVRSRLAAFCEEAERDPAELTLAVRRGLSRTSSRSGGASQVLRRRLRWRSAPMRPQASAYCSSIWPWSCPRSCRPSNGSPPRSSRSCRSYSPSVAAGSNASEHELMQ